MTDKTFLKDLGIHNGRDLNNVIYEIESYRIPKLNAEQYEIECQTKGEILRRLRYIKRYRASPGWT